jgi:hypothetical protein
MDFTEPQIAVLSYLCRQGKEVYHTLNSPERYASIYGPMLFILNGACIALMGPSIFSAKIGGAVAGTASLVLLFIVLRKKIGTLPALILTDYTVLMYLRFSQHTFWNRADPYLLFLTALGLWAVTGKKKLAATAVMGLCLGVACNLKVHGGMYLLPLLVLFLFEYGCIPLCVAGGIACLTIATPFLFWDNISLINYIAFLGNAAKHGLSIDIFLRTGTFFLTCICLPVIYGLGLIRFDFRLLRTDRRLRAYAGALLLTAALAMFFGSKQGAGEYHLLPLVILAAYLFDRRHTRPAGAQARSPHGALVATVAAVYVLLQLAPAAVEAQRQIVKTVSDRDYERGAAAEIRHALKKYPDRTVEMGYGGPAELAYFRPLVVFAQNHCFIDAAAVMDLERAGLGIPQSTRQYLAQGRTEIFLIPRGGSPFGTSVNYSWYGDIGMFVPLFDDTFKKTFLDNYELIEKMRYYEIWGYKKLKLGNNTCR